MWERALQLRNCSSCVSLALHVTTWNGGVEMPCLALVPANPHILWSAQGVVGIYGLCMHTSVQLPFFLCQDPTSQQAEASPAHKFPEDESSAALGAQQYQLFILPGLWDERHLFYQQLIFSDKRSLPKVQVWIAVWQCRILHPVYNSGSSLSYLVLLCCINFKKQKWLYHSLGMPNF